MARRSLAALLTVLLAQPGWAARVVVTKVGAVKTPVNGAAGAASRPALGSVGVSGTLKPGLSAITPAAAAPKTQLNAVAAPSASVAAPAADPLALPAALAAPAPRESAPAARASAAKADAPAPAVGSRAFSEHLKSAADTAREISAAAQGGAAQAGRAHAAGNKFFHGDGEREDPAPSFAEPGGGGGDGRDRPPGSALVSRGGNFARDLIRYGASPAAVAGLIKLLEASHPGDPRKIYHGLSHSVRVANTLAAILNGSAADGLGARDKLLLLVAAAFHDVDPARAPGTPARVSGTLAYLDSDPAAAAALAAFGISAAEKERVKALIKFTDFSPNAEALAQIQRDAEALARAAFGPQADAWIEWGRRLAYADQTAMYLGDVVSARQAVIGLAHEFRALSGKETPTDEMVLKGSAGFLKPLLESPDLALLPQALQDNFRNIYTYFSALAGPPAPSAAPAAAPQPRGPPANLVDAAVARVERYIAGIAGGIKLDAAQRRALFELALEELGVPAHSELGKAVEARLYPEEAARRTAALAPLDPRFAHFGDLILELSTQYGLTVERTQRLLARDPDVAAVLATTRDRELLRRAVTSVLDRARVEAITARYPENAQGEFMRALGMSILTPSGKSIEETSRAGAFAYVTFRAGVVTDATTGRDPDQASADMVFYVTLESDGRWKIGGYRKNTRRPGTDAELRRHLVRWLVAGGIPDSDIQ